MIKRKQQPHWARRILLSLGMILGSSFASTAGIGFSAAAVQLADGTVSFVQVPQLVAAKTFNKGTGSMIATYYFTVTVPSNAGESLQRLILQQTQGTSVIKYNLAATRAYLEQSGRPTVGIKAEQLPANAGSIALTFDPPITPGQTVTFSLVPVMNPSTAGVYLFSLTAFPQAERPNGQLLGLARLQFYNTGGRSGSQ